MSQYGETFNISNNHQIDIKAKLDSLLSKNTEIEVNNDGVESLLTSGNSNHSSIDSKIVSCNTGACVVSSSALPSGASSEAKQDINNASNASIDSKITACNTGDVNVSACALPTDASKESKQDQIKTKLDTLEASNQAIKTAVEGTITVSSPAVVKSSSTPISNEAINGQSSFTSSEIDINSAKHISIVAESSDTVYSHELDVEVSNSSGGIYYPTSHSAYFLDGKCHLLVQNIPYRYIKIKVKNGDGDVGNSADFTAHLLQST